MKFSNLWSKANLIASYLLGGGGEYRKIILSCEGEELTLPVTPWKYSITTSQNNKVVDILDFGEALLFGNARLKQLKFGCFFPNQERHEGHKFIVGDNYSPTECIDQIIKWKESKEPVRVIITDSPVNFVFGIMDFSYNEKDGSRDIWYEIKFNEYKDLNTPPANNDKQIDENTGLKNRPSETQDTVNTQVNNQANVVANRQNNENGGIPIKMTGGIQAPHGCFDQVSNQSQSTIKGIINARDALEVSKAAYKDFKHLQTLKDKNNLLHVGLKAVREGLAGKAFQI
ncbi:MAG: hypothetical protein IJ728_04940 [Selenomonadaceae bacterium]|nr:hypothetical protein [Selenomonadaceae bacterium]